MNRKYLKTIFVVLPAMAIAAIGYTNCSRFGYLHVTDPASQTDLGSSAGPGAGEGEGPGNGEVEEVSSAKIGMPFALLSAEQTKVSMLRVSGVNTCGGLRAEYNRRYSSLAAGNDITLINGPLLLGSTSMAGEICNCLYGQERALADGSRVFYNGINFNSGLDALSEAAFLTSIRGMARSFWGRNETTEELAALAQFRTDFTQGVAAGGLGSADVTRSFINATCSAMLSSVDSLSY